MSPGSDRLARRRGARLLAWLLCCLSLAFAGLGLGLLARDWGVSFPSDIFAFRGASGLVGTVFSIVAVVLAVRRPGNPIGWYFTVAGLGETFQFAAMEYVGGHVFGRHSAYFVDPLISLQTWLWLPAVVLCTTFTFLRYPNGELLGPRWRFVERFAVFAAATFCVGLALSPARVTNLGTVLNPYGVQAPWVTPIIGLGSLTTIGCVVVAAVSLVLRSRRGTAIERAQIAWLAYAACIVGSLVAPTIFGSGFSIFPHVVTKVFQDLLILSVGAIPVAVTSAMLRYRLYDIDRFVSRTVSYLLVTGALVGVYVGMVALATDVLPLSGSIGTATSVLAAVALFNPLRRRIQRVVDRRFNRARYDAEATVEEFVRGLREEVALDSLPENLMSVVGRTIQPVTVNVWLRDAP